MPFAADGSLAPGTDVAPNGGRRNPILPAPALACQGTGRPVIVRPKPSFTTTP